MPDGVTVDGRFYHMDFDFRNVLRFLDTLARDDLLPVARDYLAIKCLTRHPRNVANVLPAVRALLFGETPTGGSGERVTSFEQDAGLIRAAFRQAYGINLWTVKMHWLEFTELLHNLPQGTRYEEIISIRARTMPAPTKYNAKEREWLLKAKASVAIHLTDREAARKRDRDINTAFTGMLSMLKKGGDSNNGK